jgi:hypothetical protein
MNSLRKIIREQIEKQLGGNHILYSGVIIEDPKEIEKLKQASDEFVPSDWVRPDNYHMTISLGPLPDSLKFRGDLNKEVTLKVTAYGQSEKAFAFKVTGYMTKGNLQHITMAYNPKEGGRPVDSNYITGWVPIKEFEVNGIIREIPRKQ